MFNLISKELIIRRIIQRGIEEPITQEEGRASVSVGEEKVNMREKSWKKRSQRIVNFQERQIVHMPTPSYLTEIILFVMLTALL